MDGERGEKVRRGEHNEGGGRQRDIERRQRSADLVHRRSRCADLAAEGLYNTLVEVDGWGILHLG